VTADDARALAREYVTTAHQRDRRSVEPVVLTWLLAAAEGADPTEVAALVDGIRDGMAAVRAAEDQRRSVLLRLAAAEGRDRTSGRWVIRT
jgi:hypothetical protein